MAEVHGVGDVRQRVGSDRTAAGMAARLARGAVTSEQLTADCLARIDAEDPVIRAFVVVDHEGALAQARHADAERAAGAAKGPLHGVPVAIKDCFTIEGMSVSCGVPALAAATPGPDAPAVAALRGSGAVILGTTSTPPMLSDIQTSNPIVGRTDNPWDPDRSAGGSSGGAAAALAAGLAPYALGSDLSGSIRIPAAWCGVTALKPTHGIVSKRGHIPGRPGPYPAPQVSVAGPMGVCVEDLRLALEVLAHPEVEDGSGWSLALPAPRSTSPRDLRVAVWDDDPACRVGDEVRAALSDVADGLASLGVDVVPSRVPGGLRRWVEVFRAITAAELQHNLLLDRWTAGDGGTPDAAWSLRDFLVADVRRQELQARLTSMFDDVDAVLCAVTPGPAIPHDLERPVEDRTFVLDGVDRPYSDLSAWSAIATVGLAPAVAVPIGRSVTGLPLAAQVIGPRFGDLSALAVAGLVERTSEPAW
jgi:amidase